MLWIWQTSLVSFDWCSIGKHYEVILFLYTTTFELVLKGSCVELFWDLLIRRLVENAPPTVLFIHVHFYKIYASHLLSVTYAMIRQRVSIVVNHIWIYLIENESTSEPPLITQATCELAGHNNRVTSLAWSSFTDARLASASYDHSAQVYEKIVGLWF